MDIANKEIDRWRSHPCSTCGHEVKGRCYALFFAINQTQHFCSSACGAKKLAEINKPRSFDDPESGGKSSLNTSAIHVQQCNQHGNIDTLLHKCGGANVAAEVKPIFAEKFLGYPLDKFTTCEFID
ncbi:MAG: hypothetical protein H7A36_01970 [Chlamydiales bacterium]|nr:hypothetical protein [Chlamydiales bacterium]